MISKIYDEFKSQVNNIVKEHNNNEKESITELEKIGASVKQTFQLIEKHFSTQHPSMEDLKVLVSFKKDVDCLTELISNLTSSFLLEKKSTIDPLIIKEIFESIERDFSSVPSTENRMVLVNLKKEVGILEEIISKLGLSFLADKTSTINTNRQTALKLISSLFANLPENFSEIPASFTNIPIEQIKEAIEVEKASTPEAPKLDIVNDGKNLFTPVFAELDRLKDKLGGSPIFNGKPTMDENENKKIFFGVPIAAVKDWFRMVIDKKWVPAFFWINAAKLFGISEFIKLSQYEEAHIRIQRFGMLIANKERFFEILQNQSEDRYIELLVTTGLAWHPKENSAGTEKMYIELVEQFLTTYFEEAKRQGDEAIIEYFNTFDGVCLEDRARKIEKYVNEHPLTENMAEDRAAIAKVADWDTNQPVEVAFNKEFTALALAAGESPTPKEVLVEFQKKGIFDLEFVKDDSKVKVKPTMQDFHTWVLLSIGNYIFEPYSSEELLSIEYDLFKATGKELTVSNFVEQLKKIDGRNEGFLVDSDDTKQIID